MILVIVALILLLVCCLCKKKSHSGNVICNERATSHSPLPVVNLIDSTKGGGTCMCVCVRERSLLLDCAVLLYNCYPLSCVCIMLLESYKVIVQV